MKKGIDLIVEVEIGGELLRFAFDFKAYAKYAELMPPVIEVPKGLDKEGIVHWNYVHGQDMFLYILKATLWSGTGYEMADEEVFELRSLLEEKDYVKLGESWVLLLGGNGKADESKKKELSFAKRIKMSATN